VPFVSLSSFSVASSSLLSPSMVSVMCSVARCPMPDARCPLWSALCALSPDAPAWSAFVARCPMPDARCPMPDALLSSALSRMGPPRMPQYGTALSLCLVPLPPYGIASAPYGTARCPMPDARCTSLQPKHLSSLRVGPPDRPVHPLSPDARCTLGGRRGVRFLFLFLSPPPRQRVGPSCSCHLRPVSVWALPVPVASAPSACWSAPMPDCLPPVFQYAMRRAPGLA